MVSILFIYLHTYSFLLFCLLFPDLFLDSFDDSVNSPFCHFYVPSIRLWLLEVIGENFLERWSHVDTELFPLIPDGDHVGEPIGPIEIANFGHHLPWRVKLEEVFADGLKWLNVVHH